MTTRNDSVLRRWAMLAALLLVVGCGGPEGTDRPEDCEDDEFYDEHDQRCLPCPAAEEPECLPGCGVELVENGNECPQLQCQQGCEGCGEGEVWDDDEGQCV